MLAAWVCQGLVALNCGRLDEAEAFFNQAIRMETAAIEDFPVARTALGMVAMRRCLWRQAIERFGAALELLKRSDHMYKDLMAGISLCGTADAELRQGNARAALANCHRALLLTRQFPMMSGCPRLRLRAEAGLAAAQAAAGRPAAARESLARALGLLPGVLVTPQQWSGFLAAADLHHALALAHARLGDLDATIEHLRRAAATGWRDNHWLQTDPELSAVRLLPCFAEILDKTAPRVQHQAVASSAVNARS